jgi:hypothetical protein
MYANAIKKTKKATWAGKSVAKRRLSRLVYGPEADPGRLLQRVVEPCTLDVPCSAAKSNCRCRVRKANMSTVE